MFAVQRGTLSAILSHNAATPDEAAVTDERGTLSWSQFAALSEGYAGLLSYHGAGAGDRIALWLPNSADYFALIFACARLAAVAVHVNTRFKAGELAYLLRRSKASILVTAWHFPPVDFRSLIELTSPADREHLRCIIGSDADISSAAGLPVHRLRPYGRTADAATENAPCLTFTTSGTTSGPKLVLHRQRSVASHAADVAKALFINRHCSVLAALPLCGTFGLTLALSAAAGRSHTVFMSRIDGELAARLIRTHRVTHTAGSDDMLERIAAASQGRPFKTLQFAGFASFTPRSELAIAAADAAGMRPRGLYGSSEVQALFALAPDTRRLTDGGVPVSAAANVSIRDPDTGDGLGEGQDGELCIRAPSLFDGYLDDPGATEKAFTADGFFRTGDLAQSVAPGFLYKRRIGDSLRLGGFLVYPEEIEGFLQTLPGVAEAQVVSAEAGGAYAAFAFIRPEVGVPFDEAAILQRCRVSLARYKQPVRAIAVECFPVTESPNGVKIQRAKLRELARTILETS